MLAGDEAADHEQMIAVTPPKDDLCLASMRDNLPRRPDVPESARRIKGGEAAQGRRLLSPGPSIIGRRPLRQKSAETVVGSAAVAAYAGVVSSLTHA